MNSSSPPQLPSTPGYTPLDVKKMLLLSLLLEGTYALKGIPSTVLTNLSMYDPNTTVPFATARSLGEDEGLQSIIEKAARDFHELDKLRENLRYYLGTIDTPETEKMRKSVEKLLDEDIKERRLEERDPKILQRSLSSKAGLVAADIDRKWLGIEVHDDAHDFRIQLVTLIGGYGQGSQVHLLNFNLKTSFPKFVATLKDETRHSIIPPENITFPPLSWPTITFGNDEVQINETSTATSNTPGASSSEHDANGNGISSGSIKNAQSTSTTTTRDPNDKGYSLLDGPWMYRLPHVGKHDAPKPPWQLLRNGNDYRNMLDGINHINSKYADLKTSSKCSVVIMHSLDRECQQRYFDNREEERAFSIAWEKELEEAGFFDDEETAGVPGEDFFEYWKRITAHSSNSM